MKSNSNRENDNKTIITISGSLQPITRSTQNIRTNERPHNSNSNSNSNNNGNSNNNNNNNLAESVLDKLATINQMKERDNVIANNSITIADLIGEFGYFQLSISILAFIRYVCVAMMTHTGSLIAPEVDFWCDITNLDKSISDQLVVNRQSPAVPYVDVLKNKCELDLIDGTKYQCSAWIYNNTQSGITLTSSFDLVCEKDFYRSLYQSIVSTGLIMANIVWGSFSDRHGRKLTVQICFLWSLLFGLISCFVENYSIYTISRALCSFGDLGLVVTLITIMVETLGNKYRGTVCIISYTGWAFGVMIMPWLVEYFMNFRLLMIFTVACHLVTFPWIFFTINDSTRWLLINGYLNEARDEVHRISSWDNFFKSQQERQLAIREVDIKFNQLKQRFLLLSERKKLEKKVYEAKWSRTKLICMSLFGGLSKVKELFSNRELIIVTLAMIWITFNCELLYMTTILINSDIGADIKLNYLIGLIMECLASVLAIGMISIMNRKSSIITILLTISALCFILARTHHDESISIWVLNIDKLAVSTLSSVIYVATTELFPTNLRQTGFGLTTTLGGLGSVVGPFLRNELKKEIGMTGVLYILALLPISAASIIPFFLRETKGVELTDDMDDIGSENFDYKLRRRTSSVSSAAFNTNQQAPPVTTV